MNSEDVRTVEIDSFGTAGPFTVDVLEAIRTPEGWRETGRLLGRVRVLRCWGAMHVTSVAHRVDLLREFGRVGTMPYSGEVREG